MGILKASEASSEIPIWKILWYDSYLTISVVMKIVRNCLKSGGMPKWRNASLGIKSYDFKSIKKKSWSHLVGILKASEAPLEFPIWQGKCCASYLNIDVVTMLGHNSLNHGIILKASLKVSDQHPKPSWKTSWTRMDGILNQTWNTGSFTGLD